VNIVYRHLLGRPVGRIVSLDKACYFVTTTNTETTNLFLTRWDSNSSFTGFN